MPLITLSIASMQLGKLIHAADYTLYCMQLGKLDEQGTQQDSNGSVVKASCLSALPDIACLSSTTYNTVVWYQTRKGEKAIRDQFYPFICFTLCCHGYVPFTLLTSVEL